MCPGPANTLFAGIFALPQMPRNQAGFRNATTTVMQPVQSRPCRFAAPGEAENPILPRPNRRPVLRRDAAGFGTFHAYKCAGRSWPGKRGVPSIAALPPFDKTERLNDEIQARVHLARRLQAGAEFARQGTDQGIFFVSDPGTAASLGLRRLVDDAGRRP